jgi:predicted CXXCH cytochrome family protein
MRQLTNIRMTGFLIVLLFVFGAGASAKDYKLKPGARGKLCLNCHVDFADKLNKASVHSPVKSGDCSSCHNPHTSDHGKLLADEQGKICETCHDDIVPDKLISSHSIISEGGCTSCHDPHASDNKNNLLYAGNSLCFECHDEMKDSLSNLKTPHAPVVSNCLKCHKPHGSSSGRFLLFDNPSKVCGKCHNTTTKKFTAQHLDYPVADADCTTCHNPHGSNQKAMLYDNVHNPVAKRMCNQCHEGPASSDPLKLKRLSFKLCSGCHNEMVNKTFSSKQLHWPLAGGKSCLECHNPHTSKEESLLRGTQTVVCGRCHADTMLRYKTSKTKHEPIGAGECSACHDPHSADYDFLRREKTVIELCGNCHDWQTHSTHPIGEEHQDLRNPNLTMNCLSCHRSHGTEYEHMIPFPTSTKLCIQCHEKFRR